MKAKKYSKFETPCPRCGKKAVVTKTPDLFITHCIHCGFDMGQPRDKNYKD